MMEQLSPSQTTQILMPSAGQLLVQRLAKYQFDPEEVKAFGDYIDQARDEELYRLNPRRAAAHAEIDLRRALEIAAMGVREGIFNLLWGVNCAGCNGELCSFPNLNVAPALGEMTCPACRTQNSIAVDHQLQVTFSIHPAVRVLDLPPIEVAFPDGFLPTSKEDFIQNTTPEQQALFENLQQLAQEHAPVTGMDLLHVQMFRDFFKDQVLPVHVSLKVTRVALIFTDLRGSTAMYAAKGDPLAYNLVRQHFDLLVRETGRFGGVIIKTIGDAVMASFVREVDAARAAVAFQEAIAEFNRQNNLDGSEALILKIGLHSGPCLNVNLNDTLDYFGTTVNTAARIGSLSKGGDIVVSRAFLEDVAVQQAFMAGGYTPRETMRVILRGLPEPVEVTQLVPANMLTEAHVPLVGQVGG